MSWAKSQNTKSAYTHQFYPYVLAMNMWRPKFRINTIDSLKKLNSKTSIEQNLQDLHAENCKTMTKLIKGNKNKQRGIPCSWMGPFNTVKASVLPKSMYGFIIIVIWIPADFLYVCRRLSKNLQGDAKELEQLKRFWKGNIKREGSL